MTELQAAQMRREFLQALTANLEARPKVLRVTRGRARGHITVAVSNTMCLDVSALCFNQQPELTRVSVGGWIEATLLTEELAQNVGSVAGWLLLRAALSDKRYVWTPAAVATLPLPEQARFTEWRLTEDLAIYDLAKLTELMQWQVDASFKREFDLLAQGLFQEAAEVQADRLDRLEALAILVGPEGA